MRVETLYDSGTATIMEDVWGANHPFYMVADGVSEPYAKDGPRLMEGRLTGGQIAAIKLRNAVMRTHPVSLDTILRVASQDLEYICKRYFIEDIGMMPGATFALAEIGENSIALVQGGDCFILWMTKDGEVGATPNKVLAHEVECRAHIARLMEKHGGDRREAMEEFRPILTNLRRAHANNPNDPAGYCVFNGQPEMNQMLWRKTIAPVSILILSTDGLFAFGETGDENKMAQNAIKVFREEGLRAMLARTRKIEKEGEARSHISQAEATVVAITF